MAWTKTLRRRRAEALVVPLALLLIWPGHVVRGLGIGRIEPLVVAPGRYDDPVLQTAPEQGLYKDADRESSSRFVKDSRQSCKVYANQCRLAEAQVCKWYGFPNEARTCTRAIMEHISECKNSADAWKDLKAEARRDVYREINKEFGTALPASAANLLQRSTPSSPGSSALRGKQHSSEEGVVGAARRSRIDGFLALGGKRKRGLAKQSYSPRSKKHFFGLCEECRAVAGDLPIGNPARVSFGEIREICACAREYGDVAGLHEKAEGMGCGADE